jgi:hypothetical protein
LRKGSHACALRQRIWPRVRYQELFESISEHITLCPPTEKLKRTLEEEFNMPSDEPSHNKAFKIVQRVMRNEVHPTTKLTECGIKLEVKNDEAAGAIFSDLSVSDVRVWSKHFHEALTQAEAEKKKTEETIKAIDDEFGLLASPATEEKALLGAIKHKHKLAQFSLNGSPFDLTKLQRKIDEYYTELHKKRMERRQLEEGFKQKRNPLALLRDLRETFVVETDADSSGGHKAAYLKLFCHGGSSGRTVPTMVASKPLRLQNRDGAVVSVATVGLPLAHTYLALDSEVSAR